MKWFLIPCVLVLICCSQITVPDNSTLDLYLNWGQETECYFVNLTTSEWDLNSQKGELTWRNVNESYLILLFSDEGTVSVSLGSNTGSLEGKCSRCKSGVWETGTSLAVWR